MTQPECRIQLLADEVIDRIAAGEVVERPASVVKELLENSIDAGARRIEIEIKDAGIRLIEIADDGCGMLQSEAMMALKRHATSKIRTEEDLEHLSSLGFRGEALASIASVSQLTLTTRHPAEEVGVRIQVRGGQTEKIEVCPRPPGTTIQVRNLFFNMPARRKFLKSDATEMAHISDTIGHLMLAWPEIAFRVTRGNQLVVATNGSGNLVDAILAIYGLDLARALLPLTASPRAGDRGVRVTGFISPPQLARTNNRFLTFLVNRRAVRSKVLQMAVSKATGSFLPRGRYPVLILDLRVPETSIDVNVHPAKTEIRFRDEGMIFATVVDVLRRALSGLAMVGDEPPANHPSAGAADAANDDGATAGGSAPPGPGGRSSGDGWHEPAPGASVLAGSGRTSGPHPALPGLGSRTVTDHRGSSRGQGDPVASVPGAQVTGSGVGGGPSARAEAPRDPIVGAWSSGEPLPDASEHAHPAGHGSAERWPTAAGAVVGGGRDYRLRPGGESGVTDPTGVRTALEPAFEPVSRLVSPRLLAQYRATYFLGEDRDGLFLVDQHVAHERVLFDSLVVTYREQKVLSQPLLFPVHLRLLPSERMVLAGHGEELARLGFSVQLADDQQFYLMAAPVMGQETLAAEALQGLLAQLLAGWEGRDFAEVRTDLLKTIACKSAIKANTPLGTAEMESLFEQLLATENPFTCPHGRPIVVRLAHRRVEQAFLRA